jgi:hypothetical protein
MYLIGSRLKYEDTYVLTKSDENIQLGNIYSTNCSEDP